LWLFLGRNGGRTDRDKQRANDLYPSGQKSGVRRKGAFIYFAKVLPLSDERSSERLGLKKP
jgi:hypothetical protein